MAAASDGWADFDLVGTFDRAEAFSEADRGASARDPFPFRRQLIFLEILQTIFIFVPLLITWAALQQAADAYHRMLADPATSAAAQAGNFLELWQTGFGGKLAGPLKFEWAALYTLCAIVLLIAITITAAIWRRRADAVDDQRDLDQDTARGDLLAVLARAQLIVNQERRATPAQFVADLAAAAGSLGLLLIEAQKTQRSTLNVASRYDATARELTAAVRALHGATTDMTAIAGHVQEAARGMDESGRELSTDIRTRVSAAAARLEAATEAAQRELTDQREAGRASLERLDQQLTSTLDRVAERMSVAAGDLVAAGNANASGISSSGREAAEHISQSYQETVVAATEDLRQTVLAATAATSEAVAVSVTPLVTQTRSLTEAIEQAQAGAAGRAVQAGHAREEQIAALRSSSGDVVAAAARQESVLDRHSGALREHALALNDMADRLSGAVEAAVARQVGALDGHASVLTGQVGGVRGLGERLAVALDSASDAATAASRDALALQAAAGQLTSALERTPGQATAGPLRDTAEPTSPNGDQADEEVVVTEDEEQEPQWTGNTSSLSCWRSPWSAWGRGRLSFGVG